MHHDIQDAKIQEFKVFQLLESFKKKLLMHHPSIKKSVPKSRTTQVNNMFDPEVAT